MASVNHLPLFLCASNPTVWWPFPGFSEVLILNWSVCISLVHLFPFIKTGTILTSLYFHNTSPMLQKFLKTEIRGSEITSSSSFWHPGKLFIQPQWLTFIQSAGCSLNTSWPILTFIYFSSAHPLHSVLLLGRISFSFCKKIATK